MELNQGEFDTLTKKAGAVCCATEHTADEAGVATRDSELERPVGQRTAQAGRGDG